MKNKIKLHINFIKGLTSLMVAAIIIFGLMTGSVVAAGKSGGEFGFY